MRACSGQDAFGFTALHYCKTARTAKALCAAGVAVGETVILLTPLSIPIETPAKGRGGAQQDDSLAGG